MEDDLKTLFTYIESCYASVGQQVPRDGNKIKILEAKGTILNWVHQGHVVPFADWKREVTGETEGGSDDWNPDLKWPPWKPDGSLYEVYDG